MDTPNRRQAMRDTTKMRFNSASLAPWAECNGYEFKLRALFDDAQGI